MGAEVGNVYDAITIDSDVARRNEGQQRRRAAFILAASWEGASACDCRDDSRRGYAADAGIAEVGDVEVAGEIEGQAVGRIELRGGSRAVIARKSGCAVAGDGANKAARRDAADA